jgi:hypothetical protein
VHIDSLPIYNWFEIKKTNDLKYLYVDYENKHSVPYFFYKIFSEMIFQFEKLDLTLFELMANEQIYKSKFLLEKKPIYNSLSKEAANKLAAKQKELESMKTQTLNEFLNYIERSLGIQVGSLDSKKISTSRAYSLFYDAIETNKEKNKHHGTIKT